MRFLAFMAAALAVATLSLALLAGAPALADTVSTVATAPDGPVTTTTQVGIPIGDWLSGGAEIIAAVAAALVAWGLRQLPASAVQVLRTMQVEQLLGKAINYGVNAVAGAEKGKVLRIDVANEVVASAAQYVVDHGPGWLVSWMGGQAAIQEKILARLSVEPSAEIPQATTTLVPGIPAAP